MITRAFLRELYVTIKQIIVHECGIVSKTCTAVVKELANSFQLGYFGENREALNKGGDGEILVTVENNANAEDDWVPCEWL